jgi:hypothetical protein
MQLPLAGRINMQLKRYLLAAGRLAPADAGSPPLGVMFFAYPVRTQRKENFTLHHECKNTPVSLRSARGRRATAIR